MDEGALIEQAKAAFADGRVLFAVGDRHYHWTPEQTRRAVRQMLERDEGCNGELAQALLDAADLAERRGRPA